MRKIVFFLSVSLDGYFADPDGGLSWQHVDPELHQHFNDVLRPMAGYLTGRRMHELMTAYWPTADQDPNTSGPAAEYAGIWRDMPKTVYSRTLPPGSTDWNATVVPHVDPDEIRARQAEPDAEPGADLVVGGPDLATEFIRHDLIDEFRLYYHPVLLGRGRPLFAESSGLPPVPLRLLGTHTFSSSGVVLLHYERDRHQD